MVNQNHNHDLDVPDNVDKGVTPKQLSKNPQIEQPNRLVKAIKLEEIPIIYEILPGTRANIGRILDMAYNPASPKNKNIIDMLTKQGVVVSKVTEKCFYFPAGCNREGLIAVRRYIAEKLLLKLGEEPRVLEAIGELSNPNYKGNR